ncbi:MAG: PopZ family protein [Salinarimonas sp.]
MNQANPKTDEPSMEEILASIRRIIADDQESAQKGDEEDPFEQAMADAIGDDGDEEPVASRQADDDDLLEPEEDDDILDLAEVGEPVESSAPDDLSLEHEDIDFRQEDGQIDFDAIGTDEEDTGLEGQDAVDAAFDAIGTDDDDGLEFDAPEPEPEPEPVYTPPPRQRMIDEDRLLSQATDEAVGSAFNQLAHTVLANNGRTLDDLVKEMLRPMLKVWLDDNLPTIVERMVRAEIERVSRGGR